MMKTRITRLLLGSLLLGFGIAPASAQSQSYVDLQAGVGYSTNPLLRLGNSTGAGFGRISAFGFHGWENERGSTNLSAYVENSTYLREYSSKQLFSLNAATTRSLNERVRFFGNAGFSGDFGGQLGSRFFGVPDGSIAVDPNLPPTYSTVIDPDLYALNQRQYRASGQVGFNAALSPRDSLSATAGVQHVFFSRNGGLLNYTTYDGTIGYQRQLSELVAVGARAVATRSDYSNGRSLSTYGPQLTVDARLGTNWDTNLAIGFVRTEQDLGPLGGKSSSYDLAVDASVCRRLEYERICGRASRRTQSSVVGASPTSTSIGADYYRKLTARDQLQLSLAAVWTDRVRQIGLGKQNFYSLSANYDRKLTDRLAAGANVAARKLTTTGPDPKGDIGGSVFIRYRLGNLR